MVLHLDGPVMIHCRTPKGENGGLNQAGSIVLVPSGMDVRVRLGGTARSLHLYLRRALVEEVAADLIDRDPTHVEILPRFGDRDPLIVSLMRGVIDALRDEAGATAKAADDARALALAAKAWRGNLNDELAHWEANQLSAGRAMCQYGVALGKRFASAG
jgi:AraC family transcriptional regulator